MIRAGDIFGTFTVLKRDRESKWICECHCGARRSLASYILSRGYEPECLCHIAKPVPTDDVAEAYTKLVARMAALTGMTEAIIRGRSRLTLPVTVRAVIAHEMRVKGITLGQIGRAMGRDHTTVLRLLRDYPDPVTRLAVLLQDLDYTSLREGVARWSEELVEAINQDEPTVDRGRAIYNHAVAKLAELPEERRPAVWEASCRVLFPFSWQAQAAAMPRIAA